jgi:rRNA maturation protein Nop10
VSARCSRAGHEELVADPARFAAELAHVGVMDPGDGEPAIHLKNCPACGSTLARDLAPDDPVWLAYQRGAANGFARGKAEGIAEGTGMREDWRAAHVAPLDVAGEIGS